MRGYVRTRPAVEASRLAASLLALHDRQQAGRQFLAEFDAPLVEGVDVEQRALDEDAVLVERDQPAERVRVELVGRGWSSRAGCRRRRGAARSCRPRPASCPWPASAPAPPPACGPSSAPPTAPGSWRAAGRGGACRSGSWPTAAARNSTGMTSVPWCSSWKKACWPLVPGSPQTSGPVGVVDRRAVERHALAVRFHVELLQIGRQPRQALVVGDDGARRIVADHAMPAADQAQQRPAGCPAAAPCGNARPSHARHRGRRGNSPGRRRS